MTRGHSRERREAADMMGEWIARIAAGLLAAQLFDILFRLTGG